MGSDEQIRAVLSAKEDIRELAQLYARGVNGRDIDLLRKLYASDATDDHGQYFQGTASDYLDWLATTMASSIYCRHHTGNHLIAVDGDEAQGELYTFAFNVFRDGQGGYLDNMKAFRFLDRYRVEDGRWRFAHRAVVFDADVTRPCTDADPVARAAEATFTPLSHELFEPGGSATHPAG